MFRPNLNCTVQGKGGSDVYGMPIHGAKTKERCAVVKKVLRNAKTSVRADSSASRGNAREMEADVVILVRVTTVAELDAIIDAAGERFRVMTKHGRYAISGQLDHYELGCTYWNEEDV
ncbi:hypothetical protein [Acinetobacter brisouii]|uniref:hypothetical protein n=1 Tax=Acinetobacter brisouii TaxID=396323 RepID=UPI00124C5806|nr:hypothetical protein [Acinetobacter brisouii]